MSYSHSIPPTVQIRRSQLVGLVVSVAALAALLTWAVSSLAFDNGATSTTSRVTSKHAAAVASNAWRVVPPPVQLRRTARLSSLAGIPSVATTPRAVSIMSLTPAQLFAGALGGYALPNEGPTIEAVLSTMSPETRRYTESVMNLTIEQLAAGAAGHP